MAEFVVVLGSNYQSPGHRRPKSNGKKAQDIEDPDELSVNWQ